ncbi:MAG: ankyrin repeat domain-containing protein [Erythrobacter sp.]
MIRRAIQAVFGFAALALVASPSFAQAKREGYEFLEAVRDRDGTKATELLNQPGNVLINTRDITNGETALHIVTQRRDPTWMRFVLAKGANPNVETKDKTTPLQIAAQLGFIEGIEILLDHGALVDPSNIAGETPLISAVHRRDLEMIRVLIEKGANPSRADNSGRTARDYAVLLGNRSPVLEEIDKALAERSAPAQTYGPK